MKPVTYLTLTETVTFFSVSLIIVPLVGFIAAWVGNHFAAATESKAKNIWIKFAYIFIPVGLAMHLAHNFSHILLEGKSILPALQHAVNRFSPFSLGEPIWKVSPLVSPDVVSFLQMFFILGGFILAIVAGYRLTWNNGGKECFSEKILVPFIIVAFSITVLNLYLLSQPMGARHGM